MAVTRRINLMAGRFALSPQILIPVAFQRPRADGPKLGETKLTAVEIDVFDARRADCRQVPAVAAVTVPAARPARDDSATTSTEYLASHRASVPLRWGCRQSCYVRNGRHQIAEQGVCDQNEKQHSIRDRRHQPDAEETAAKVFRAMISARHALLRR
jgi:hypothetical protein